MKKIIGFLLISLTVFFNIDGVSAEGNIFWGILKGVFAPGNAIGSEIGHAVNEEVSKFEWSGLGFEKKYDSYKGTCSFVGNKTLNDNSSVCEYACRNNPDDELLNDDNLSFNYYIFYNPSTDEIVHSIDPDSVVVNGDVFNSFKNNQYEPLEQIKNAINSLFGIQGIANLKYVPYMLASTTLIKPDGLFSDSDNVPLKEYFVSLDTKTLSCKGVVPTIQVTYSATLGMTFNFVKIGKDPTYYDKDLDKNIYGSENNACGMLGGEGSEFVSLLKQLYGYIKILIPILIVAFSIVDFIKVVVSGKDDDMKKAISKFIKRIIIGVIFILVPFLISLLINISGLSSQYEGLGDGVKAIFCIFG